MLTLILTLENGQVTVHANGRQSHIFLLPDLNVDLKNFVNDPKPYGVKLFQALFKDDSDARKMFDDLSKQVERTIVLVLESSELDGIAWEYAYHDNAYIVEDFAFIRALPEKERPHSNGRLSKSVERVPLLFIPANPLVDLSGEPMRELDIECEWLEMMQHIVKSNAPFDLIELRPASPAALQSVMARFQNGMIAHFSGHGAATKDGAFLLFENENGSSNPLEAREFVREVKDQAWIGFLSACQSAVAERTEYSNLARELVKAGVPFALGMQFNLPDPFAPNISGQFYNYLSQGHAVPEAARQARRAVKRENEFYVGMIALYAAHPDEVGKIGWTGSGARTLPIFAAADVSDLPSPASGLIGRQRELMNIGTSLLGKKKPNTVTLHGAGGIGKTALMRQALLRFAPSFESALAIALDPLPSLESVLGRLERFLKLPSPCSNDTKERERTVRERLTSKRTLSGLDNFETLIHARDNGSDEEKKIAKSLYAFFKSLSAEGVTLCVTSREKTSLPGEMIQEIHGLEDEVGGRLFQNTVSTRRGALNETGLERISAAVDGHPLALRLLAPIFEEQAGLTLDDFIQKLEIFLPKAHDEWTEQERHESLGACFAFSIDNLPKTEEGNDLQTAISRLSVFIAFFVGFTAAPVLESKMFETEEEVVAMRERASNTLHALWERGLLERLTLTLENENFYLYKLHPTLGLFAKQRLTDAKTTHKYYWQSMNNFADIADEQITKSALIAQITSRAMPDLLIAAESNNDEHATLMQFRVSKLLKQFGLYNDSLRLIEKVRDAYQSLNDLQGKGASLLLMASIYVALDNPYVAMKLYQESLEIFDALGNLNDKAKSLGGLALIQHNKGEYQNSTKLQEEAIAILDKLGDLENKARALNELAGNYQMRGDLDGAMKLYQQSLEVKEGSGDLMGKRNTLSNMAGTLVMRGDLDGAMKLHEQALEIVENFGDLNLEVKASTLQGMANIYFRRGDLDKAMKLHEQALEIVENLGDLNLKAYALHGMANIYFRRGDLDRAMKLHEQALEIFVGLGDLMGKSAALSNIAGIFDERGDSDRAMNLYQQALQIEEIIGNPQAKSVILYQMAGIFITHGDLDKAVQLYEQALQISEYLGNLIDKASTLSMMAKIDAMQKNYRESLNKLLSAMNIAKKNGTNLDKESFAGNMKKLQSMMGLIEFEILWKELTGQPLPEWLA